MTDDFKSLEHAVACIVTIFAKIEDARKFPEEAVEEASRIWVSNGNAPKRHYDVLERARGLMRDEALAVGTAKKREAMHTLSMELEAIRATLPALAARATIALGVIARNVMEESRND